MPSAARTADCAPSAATTRRASSASPPSVSRRIASAPAADRRDPRIAHADPRERGDPRAQRPAEQAVLDGVAERCDALLLGRQERGAEAAALGHVDAPDRRRPGGDRRPGADALEHAPAAARERRRARVEARLLVGARRDRLDHDDVERQVGERRGEREARPCRRRRWPRRSAGTSARSCRRHQALDLVGIGRHAGGQDFRLAVGDDDVVLDAHADAPPFARARPCCPGRCRCRARWW